MRIGELARQAGVDVQTVRYYEREGLLEAPARTGSGYRTYGPQHLERLNFVRHCRSLDLRRLAGGVPSAANRTWLPMRAELRGHGLPRVPQRVDLSCQWGPSGSPVFSSSR